MSSLRPTILTIGGFDPCGGAGVLTDVKTFERLKVYGMAVNTANTVQSEDRFGSMNWLAEDLIWEQLNFLKTQYRFKVVKIGIVPSIRFLNELLDTWKDESVKIIWDPVLSISAGFDLKHDLEAVKEAAKKVYMITPNRVEMEKISGMEAISGAKLLSEDTLVYLKGGHAHDDELGKDHIFEAGELKFSLRSKSIRPTAKHGSGCILSSALAAYLAQGYPLHRACVKAKEYISRALDSNSSLLAYHNK
jgi:hydroxymethylpyrimidine/phosphomethylpyrimidine kinase